jgi:glycine/D-amino acid oxidase-like deaminating enzyme
MRENHCVQAARGASNVLLDRRELNDRFPWLSGDGVALASLGVAGEGWFDGYSLMRGLAGKAKSLGCRYLTADARRFVVERGRLASVELADGGVIRGDVFVLAAGCWSAALAATVGIDLPVRARLRNVFSFACRSHLENCPLVVDTTGVWFRPEGTQQFICGFSPRSDPDNRPLEVDYAHWEETLWPALAARVPAFEEVKMIGAWAGYYEFNTFDQNGIIGPHSAYDNLVFATGFSGHGMMQSPGVGISVAEIICLGETRTIDVRALGWGRVEAGLPVFERNVI